MKVHNKPFNILILSVILISKIFALKVCSNELKTDSYIDTYCINDNAICKIVKNENNYTFQSILTSDNNNKVFLFKSDGILITSEDENISEGYICSENKCNIISNEGSYINSSRECIATYENKFTKCVYGNGIYLNGARNGLKNALIDCNNNSCAEKDGSPGIYINAAGNGLTKALIKCNSEECKLQNGSSNGTYINKNVSSGLEKAIIKCKTDSCIEEKASENDIYINSDVTNSLIKALIKCEKNCSISDACTSSDNEYFIDANSYSPSSNNKRSDSNNDNDINNNASASASATQENKGIIICSKKNEKCERKRENSPEGYYLNYGNDKTSKPLIFCELNKNIKCESTTALSSNIYYINSGETDNIIYCSGTDQCEIFISPAGDFFYISGVGKANGKDALIYCDDGKCNLNNISNAGYFLTFSNDINGLIKCNAPSTGSTSSGSASSGSANSGSASSGSATTENPCILNTPSTFNGYFINGDSNLRINYPLIKCSNDGCISLKLGTDILPGFYYNADSDATNKIIACDENKCDLSNYTSGRTVKGSYLLAENKDLKLYVGTDVSEDGYSIVSSDIDDTNALYYYVEVGANVFPSINVNIATLFKISKYSITRLIVDSNFSIESVSHKVTNGGTVGSDIDLYVCTSKTKICTQKNSCLVNTYLLDKNDYIAYYCKENSVLVKVKDPGYYIDSSRANTAYVIKCISSNSNLVCEYVSSPKYYFINAGYDKASNPLIYCDSVSCSTVSAEIGNYLSGIVVNNLRNIIKCSSASNCSIDNNIKSVDHYYINSGFDKINKPLINCYNKNCSTINVTIGNYITEDSSVLIKCESYSNCYTFSASAGFYDYAFYSNNGESKKKIIECELKSSVICEPKEANSGFYVSNTSNVLINCTGNDNKCTTIVARNGIFRSATTRITTTSKKRNNQIKAITENEILENAQADDDDDDDDDDNVDDDNNDNAKSIEHEGRYSKIVYNIIICTANSCTELSANELAAIPYCTFDNNKCFINNKLSTTSPMISSIAPGGYCTNSDREVFYFATDTIVTETDILYGSSSIYTYTTTSTNCIKVSSTYSSNYFTVNNNIYHIDEGQITQIVNSGFYFINVHTNTLVSGNDIEDYNDENVKLFKCNDNNCVIVDKPTTTTYIADVNKRIIKYNLNSDTYVFAYENDIICMYSNNKCIPRADLKNQEFCITYKGELVLASSNIKSRETGDCYKSTSINNPIYGYSQYLYSMTTNYASVVDETAYYIISLSSNTTATYKDYTSRNNPIKIYGCASSQCNEIEPSKGVYYYDQKSKYLSTYNNGIWKSPSNSGYALISTNPNEQFIYKFTINVNTNKVTLNYRVPEGYYYTDDEEMYHCNENDNVCTKIDDSGYFFTNSGEIFYCLYDSEGLEKTVCTKQSCHIGQFYYIEEKYYRCESGSFFSPVSSKYCKHDENVIINFLTAYSEEYPTHIRNAVEGISTNNNSTAVISAIGKNYMNVVPGIFTNCTYNVEDKSSSFDLVCINNFVSYNKLIDNVEICSISQMGYIECIEDENNSNKCKVSGAISKYSKNIFTMLIILLISSLYLYI